MIKYFGKLLLLVIVPISFIVVSSTLVSSLIALISYHVDKVPFNSAFVSVLSLITTLMTLIALLGLGMFFVNKED